MSISVENLPPKTSIIDAKLSNEAGDSFSKFTVNTMAQIARKGPAKVAKSR